MPPTEDAFKRNQLRRDLTLIDAIGIGLGAIIGAGIFTVKIYGRLHRPAGKGCCNRLPSFFSPIPAMPA
jgi:hypothetical protein